MNRHAGTLLAWAVALMLGACLLWWSRTGLLDPDTWMRLAVVEHAVSHGSLLDYSYPRDGAPLGMQVMWTMPTNLFVAALAAPLAVVGGWHWALASMAPFYGPLSLMAVAAATWFLCTSLGLRALGPWSALVAVCLPALQAYCAIGRVGHHGLSTAMGSVALALALRSCLRPLPSRAALAGLACVLCLWQSIELVPAVLMAWAIQTTGLALRASAVRAGSRRAALVDALAYTLAMVLASGLALVLDPGPGGVLDASSDRWSILGALSLLVLGLTSMASTWWAGCHVRLAPAQGTGVRAGDVAGKPAWSWLWMPMGATLARTAAAGAVGLAVLAGALLVWAPTPARFDDPFVVAYLWVQDTENKSLLQTRDAWPMFLSLPPALLWLAWGAWRRRARSVSALWLLALALLGAATLAGVLSVRLAPYSAAMSCPILGAMLERGMARLAPDLGRLGRQAMLVVPLLVVCAWLVVDSGFGPAPQLDPCPVAPVAQAIEQALPTHAVVAAEMWASPELLWTTGLRTIAGPYHRNTQGVGDLARIFMLEDDGAIQDILARRGAVAVLACASPARTDTSVFAQDSLQARIRDGHPPSWLEPVPLPPGGGALQLYKVLPRT